MITGAYMRRKIKAALVMGTLGLLVIGCTIDRDSEGNQRAQAHNPLESMPWDVASGDGTCTVSSGWQGIDVVLHKVPAAKAKGKKKPGTVASVVTSTRSIEPGSDLKINIGYHYYESQTDTFSAADSKALIADLQTNAPAYVTFNAIHVGRGTRHESTILGGTNFSQAYAQCTKQLLK